MLSGDLANLPFRMGACVLRIFSQASHWDYVHILGILGHGHTSIGILGEAQVLEVLEPLPPYLIFALL